MYYFLLILLCITHCKQDKTPSASILLTLIILKFGTLPSRTKSSFHQLLILKKKHDFSVKIITS